MDHPLRAAEPFLLVGLLANYDKFETQNQYKERLADFCEDEPVEKVVQSIGWTCKLLQDHYVAICDDSPAIWSIGNTLSYVGLGALTRTKPAAPVLSEDEQRILFAEQCVFMPYDYLGISANAYRKDQGLRLPPYSPCTTTHSRTSGSQVFSVD